MGHVSLKGIHKSYGQQAIIKGIDLEVHQGEFLVFVGPSGCGKSTTLRMIAGLEDITAGELWIDGAHSNHTPAAERGVAMVFQSYALYPHMTVADNMGFALKMAGVTTSERMVQVQRTAQALHMDHLLNRYPKELSGGERQRVAIGRAIVRKPKVFLFDEPLSNLDAALRVNMRIELARLHKELGTTMIYVTHDQVEAMTMGDRIAVFNQGRIEQIGTPLSLYEQPANEFVATFLGSPRMNLIECPAQTAHVAQAWWLHLASPFVAVPHKLGLRPEHLRLAPSDEGLPAVVVLAEHLGDASIYHCEVAGLPDLLNVKIAAGARAHRGDRIGLIHTEPSRVVAFNAGGVRLSS
jgi:multiple sugar transport system ATP-binding protein